MILIKNTKFKYKGYHFRVIAKWMLGCEPMEYDLMKIDRSGNPLSEHTVSASKINLKLIELL